MSPLKVSALTAEENGQKTFTHTFAEPFGYQFNACYFAADGSTFGDSESGYQTYPIIAMVPPEVTQHPDDVTAYPGDTVSFTAAGGALNVTVPSNRNLVPPGHYMLFLLNSEGVPSIAKIVRVG